VLPNVYATQEQHQRPADFKAMREQSIQYVHCGTCSTLLLQQVTGQLMATLFLAQLDYNSETICRQTSDYPTCYSRFMQLLKML